MSQDTLTTLSKVQVLTESMMNAFKESSALVSKEIIDKANDVKTHITNEILRIKT